MTDFSKVDWSLPCAEIAASLGHSLNYIYTVKSELGITVAKARIIKDQPSDHKLIRCRGGVITRVSNEDYERVSKTAWYIGTSGYPYARIKGKHWSMHKFIMGIQVDHKDRDPLNNQRSNFRPSTQRQNCFNRAKNKRVCSSRFKGVCRVHNCVSKPWQANIHINGKQTFIGYYSTEEEAARAYDARALVLFGDFAALNFQVDNHPTPALVSR